MKVSEKAIKLPRKFKKRLKTEKLADINSDWKTRELIIRDVRKGKIRSFTLGV